jgi:Family of unknown function (DUF5681)
MQSDRTASKQRGRPFQSGHSGNPAGRPKGARNRSTIAAEMLLEGEAQALTRKAIELAKAGDTTALKLCLERLLPPRKDRPTSFELPMIQSPEDSGKAISAVLSAVAEGRITPNEAIIVMGLIEAQCRVIGQSSALPMSVSSFQVSFVPGDSRPMLEDSAEKVRTPAK